MTVLVRPAPPRVWGNNIRPFQAVKPGPQVPTYTLKTWKPPVPEPLPPAPLLGLPSLLALGTLVLAQIWGLFGSRGAGRLPGSDEYFVNLLNDPITVRYTVNVIYDGVLFQTFSGTHVIPPGHKYDEPPDSEAVQIASPPPWDEVLKVVRLVRITAPDGSYTEAPAINSIPSGVLESPVSGTYKTPSNSTNRHEWDLRVVDGTPEGGDPTADPERLPGLLPSVPLTDLGLLPAPFPWITPEELEILRPRPLPLPGGEDLPDPNNPQPQPAPEVPPFPLPVPAPPLVPPLPPGQILPPGFPPPVPVPPAPVPTPPDWHFPVPGLPIPPAPPPPTLDGIALEVGRIENKVARLLTPGGGTPLDQLGTLVSLVSTLLEILQSITAGGSYTLEAPCETAEDGSPLVVEHTYSGALNSFGVLSNKIDAIAAVLQTHKNQKQPICKAPPRQGQAVTVNFEEV